jgi:hypothetical protein
VDPVTTLSLCLPSCYKTRINGRRQSQWAANLGERPIWLSCSALKIAACPWRTTPAQQHLRQPAHYPVGSWPPPTRRGLNGRLPWTGRADRPGGRCGWRAVRPLCSLPLTPGRRRWGGVRPEQAPLDAPPELINNRWRPRSSANNAGSIWEKMGRIM